MTSRIPRLPTSHRQLGALYAHINRIADELESLRPRTSHKTLTSWGATGVTRQSLQSVTEEGAEGLPTWLP